MIIIDYNKQNYVIDNNFNISGDDKNFVDNLKVIVKSILINYDVSQGFEISYIAQNLKDNYNINIVYVDDENMENSEDYTIY